MRIEEEKERKTKDNGRFMEVWADDRQGANRRHSTGDGGDTGDSVFDAALLQAKALCEEVATAFGVDPFAVWDFCDWCYCHGRAHRLGTAGPPKCVVDNYSARCPDLETLIPAPLAYLRAVKRIGNHRNISKSTLKGSSLALS